MTKKFGLLRFIADLYKILGIILLIIGVLGAIAILLINFLGPTIVEDTSRAFGFRLVNLFGGVLGAFISALAAMIGFGFSALCNFAVSEAILVFLSIEENTRVAAIRLSHKDEPNSINW